MGASKYKLLIENFDTIRRVLHSTFLFGCYTREDYEEKEISGRKYDNEISRIKWMISERYLKEERLGKKKVFHFDYQYLHNPENYLAGCFKLKTYKPEALATFFLIMRLMDMSKEPFTLKSILDGIGDYSCAYPKEETIRRQLLHMETHGLIKRRTRNGKNEYELPSAFLNDLSDSEFAQLKRFVEVYISAVPPAVPGIFMKEKLKRMTAAEGENAPIDSVFVFRNSPFQYLLEEEILWKLLTFIDEKKIVDFDFINGEAIEEISLLPIKLLFDSEYGRWYLAGKKESEKIRFYRLDKIYKLEKSKVKIPSSINDEKHLREKLDKVWKISGEDGAGQKGIRIRFFDNWLNEGFFLAENLRKIKPEITVETWERGVILTIPTADPIELLPWIRKHGAQMEILGGDEAQDSFRKKIREEWRVLLEKYGDDARV